MTRRKKPKRSIPYFTFTPATIKITQDALKLFEQSLQRTDHQHPKKEFAKETMKQVNSKLDTMSQCASLLYLTTFDYNERVVITAAIHLYTINLMSSPSCPEREEELAKCQQIAAYFALNNPKLEA